MERLTLNYVWKQKVIPVVLRRIGRGEKLRVRLPSSDDNRQWLQNGRRTTPEWIGGNRTYGELPKSWFDDFVDRALLRYGKVYIIQPYREQEKCRLKQDIAPRFLFWNRLVTVLCRRRSNTAPAASKCYNRANDVDSWRSHKNIFAMIFPLKSKA